MPSWEEDLDGAKLIKFEAPNLQKLAEKIQQENVKIKAAKVEKNKIIFLIPNGVELTPAEENELELSVKECRPDLTKKSCE